MTLLSLPEIERHSAFVYFVNQSLKTDDRRHATAAFSECNELLVLTGQQTRWV
jgi:hypothetical protein